MGFSDLDFQLGLLLDLVDEILAEFSRLYEMIERKNESDEKHNGAGGEETGNFKDPCHVIGRDGFRRAIRSERMPKLC
jgi:hypothetical protein